MAKLELPIRAFVADFCSRAFPNRAFGPGSAVGDLVITPMAALLQPLRHEIDAIKVAQSITNYQYMTAAEMDALAANWGYARQNGGRSSGTVRLFFDTATDYQINYLEFVANDGAVFVLVAPVRILTVDLLRNRNTDAGQTTYSYDVTVISNGIGSRYAVTAGAISSVRNAPPNLIRVSNPSDFVVTAPEQTNYDVFNALYRNVGLKNLVSRASIRSPLYDNFPGILDIFVSGVGHSKMLRDLVTTELPDGTTSTIHVGGAADVWLNTINIQRLEQEFTYVPTSRLISLVSSAQATAREVAYTFAQSVFTMDGEYLADDGNAPVVDESMSIECTQAGLPLTAFITAVDAEHGRASVAARDVVRGESLIGMPGGTTVADFSGVNFQVAGVQRGDVMVLGAETTAAITDVSPDVLRLAPARTIAKQYVMTAPTAAGMFQVILPEPVATDTVYGGLSIRVGDRAVIPHGPAAGMYSIAAVGGSTLWLIVHLGTPTVFSATGSTYEFSTPVDPQLAVGDWVVTSIGPIRIVTVNFLGSTVQVVLDTPHGGNPVVALWRGLQGALRAGDILQVEREVDASPLLGDAVEAASRGALYANQLARDWDMDAYYSTATFAGGELTVTLVGHPYVIGQWVTVTHASWTAVMRITAVTDNTFTGASTASTGSGIPVTTAADILEAPGIGSALGSAFAVLTVDGTAAALHAATLEDGGDGTYYTSLADAIDDHRIRIRPALPLTLPANTSYALVRPEAVTAIPVAARDNAGVGGLGRIQLNLNDGAMPAAVHGSADWIGTLIDTNLDGRHATVVASDAEAIAWVYAEAGRVAQVLTFDAVGYTPAVTSLIGSTVSMLTGSSTISGKLEEYSNSARTWVVSLNDPVHPFTTGTVRAGSAGGDVTGVAAFANGPAGFTDRYGYWPVVAGNTVRQGDLTAVVQTVVGTAASSPRWEVRMTLAGTSFEPGLPVFVDPGTGYPQETGNARQRAIVRQTPPDVLGAPSGTMWLTLSRPLGVGELAMTSCTARWRFPATAALLTPNGLRVSAATSNTVFSAVRPTDDSSNPCTAQFVLGTATGSYRIEPLLASDPYRVGASGSPDVVRLATAPATTQQNNVTAAYGATSLTLPGTVWGRYARPGRVLRLTIDGVTQYLECGVRAAATADNVVILRQALAISITSGQTVEADIVEGFCSPYMILQTARVRPFRITRPPQFGDLVPAGLAPSGTTGDHTFTANGLDFNAIFRLAAFDAPHSTFLLHVDSGDAADVEPYRIVGIQASNRVEVDRPFALENAAGSFHLTRRNASSPLETWIRGTVSNADFNSNISVTVKSLGLDLMALKIYGSAAHIVCGLQVLTGGFVSPSRVIDITVASTETHTIVLELDQARLPAGVTYTSLHGAEVLVLLRIADRTITKELNGAVLNSYDYYVDSSFMTLPIVRIVSVELLDDGTGQVVKSLPWVVHNRVPGLRYSADEQLQLEILDETAVYQPVRVSYAADPSIITVNAFLNDPDNSVVNANHLAKRMETMDVDVAVAVRSERTSAELSTLLAQFINSRRSTQTLGKDSIIRFLYDENLVTSVDTSALILSGQYTPCDGPVQTFTTVDALFGADTACYVARNINVTRL